MAAGSFQPIMDHQSRHLSWVAISMVHVNNGTCNHVHRSLNISQRSFTGAYWWRSSSRRWPCNTSCWRSHRHCCNSAASSAACRHGAFAWTKAGISYLRHETQKTWRNEFTYRNVEVRTSGINVTCFNDSVTVASLKPFHLKLTLHTGDNSCPEFYKRFYSHVSL